MTDTQKQSLFCFGRALALFAAGAFTTAFATGLTIGSELEEFKSAAVRSIENRSEIRAIQLQIAEDRIVTRHILELLNEVRTDVKYMRENQNR